jgi:hypothetical protein
MDPQVRETLRKAVDARRQVRRFLKQIEPESASLPTLAQLRPIEEVAGTELIDKGRGDRLHVFSVLQVAKINLDEVIAGILSQQPNICSECGRSVITADQPGYGIQFGDGPVVHRPFDVVYCVDGCKLHFLCAFGKDPAVGLERMKGYDAYGNPLDPCPSSHESSEQ